MKNIFLDCGSNLGQGFEYFSSIYIENYEYILFEPNPYCYNFLVEKYNDRSDMKIYNQAVFNNDCYMDFSFTSMHDVGGSLIKQHNSNYEKHIFETVQTKCINLINLVNEIHSESSNRDIVIKLDIEASEYAVLESMIESGSIFKVKKIYCEFHSQYMNEYDRKQFLQREHAILEFAKHNAISIEIWH